MEIRERNRALKAKTIADFIEKCKVSGDPAYENRADFAEILQEVHASADRKAAQAAAREAQNVANTKTGANASSPARLWHPGMELVIAGVIGKLGTRYLGKYKKEELLKTLPKAFVALSEKKPFADEIDPSEEKAEAADGKIQTLVTPTNSWEVGEGGMYRTLNELAADTGRGFFIDYTKAPVSQVTIEFCEVFELDPWQLFSGDCTLYVVERASDLVRELEARGIPCAAVGMLTSDNDKAICHRETRSLLNRPGADELLKLLKADLKAEAVKDEAGKEEAGTQATGTEELRADV